MKKLLSALLSAMLCFSVVVADTNEFPLPENDGTIVNSQELPEGEGKEGQGDVAPCADSGPGLGGADDTNG